jgi:hypothetical protein
MLGWGGGRFEDILLKRARWVQTTGGLTVYLIFRDTRASRVAKWQESMCFNKNITESAL